MACSTQRELIYELARRLMQQCKSDIRHTAGACQPFPVASASFKHLHYIAKFYIFELMNHIF